VRESAAALLPNNWIIDRTDQLWRLGHFGGDPEQALENLHFVHPDAARPSEPPRHPWFSCVRF